MILQRLSPHYCSLAAAAGLALVIRLPGLTAALYMDEVHILRAVNHYVTQMTIIPPWFDWSPLFSYLSVPAVGLSALMGGVTSELSPTDWLLINSALANYSIVIGTRILSLMFSVATALILWFAPHGKVTARYRFVSTLIFSLSPVAVQYGAWGLADTGMVFGVAAATLFALRYQESAQPRELLYAGACAGVAAAFKYNGALATLLCATSALLASAPTAFARRLKSLGGAAVICATIFLILTPTWIFVPRQAFDGFLFELSHVNRPTIAPATTPWLGLPRLLFLNEIGMLIGYAFVIVCIALSKHRNYAITIAIVPAAILVIVGGWRRMDLNYLLPALPGLSLATAFGLRHISQLTPRRFSWCAHSILLLTLAVALTFSGRISLKPDNYFPMQRWIAENAGANATVIRVGGYTPKVWDESSINEFLNGRGQKLSDHGKLIFRTALTRQPVVGSVFEPDETSSFLATSGTIKIPTGTWVLISDKPLRNVFDAKIPAKSSPIYREYNDLLAFYGELQAGREWQLVHEETHGSGQAQYAFRKRKNSQEHSKTDRGID